MVMQQPKTKFKRIELKFLLTSEMSKAVQQWAIDNMEDDEFCGDHECHSYDINTLYLDTEELDLFHKTGIVGRTKHRIRRYGNEDSLWLETKRKKKLVVRKKRSAIHENELDRFNCQSRLDAAWKGDWFRQRLTERELNPAVQICYQRFARTCDGHHNNARLTIDRHIKATSQAGWQVAFARDNATANWQSITNHEVLELKFHDVMPQLFKNLLRQFVLPPTSFSKYSSAIQIIQSQPDLAATCLPTARATNPAESLQYA